MCLIAGHVVAAVIVLCLRPDWQSIGLGTLAFIAGSALLVWTEESKEGQSSKNLKWLKGILVPIILAFGGFLTTHGWNLRNNYLQDRSLLTAAAVEWLINKTYIHALSQWRDEYLIGGDQFSTPILVRPTAGEMRQVLTQATSFRNDKCLKRALTVYVLAVDKLVPRCEYIYMNCSQPNITVKMKKKIVETELGADENNTFQYFVKSHEQLGNILTSSSYSWSLDKAKALVDEDLLNDIENMRFNITLDPNKPS